MIILHHIRHTADEHWATCTDIYLEAFPIDEQRPTDDIARLIETDRRYCAMALIDDTHGCIGLLTSWQFTDLTFIEHFAIKPLLRAMGYGTAVLKTFTQSLSTPIILEVEPPTDSFTQRRIRFYERCGLTLYPYDYIQPPYTPDRSPVALRLMGTITQPNLTQIAHTLHREVYDVNYHKESLNKKNDEALSQSSSRRHIPPIRR
jgi:GNAT superfamily N-acetyltransferase